MSKKELGCVVDEVKTICANAAEFEVNLAQCERDLLRLVESAVALALVRLGLRLLRFQTLRRLLGRVWDGIQASPPERRLIRKVIW